ncbi:MAG TPA: phosphoribosylamine--glycine ligase [Syntrophales bacterium]|nr:phosphoribosylamine--glycine ligase [Syntrophales bacterium]HOM07529.1 phosphoribosylamine--glycine ligase [Syntrophales bacterium]HON99856.1 phosphoribosylamine--glycine ligase [Syntrophales bacterium]HPQ07126.1 phosphoribosylamine--glycine ligase [Syntrophales bacterium]HRS87948.1 phosphoribosylamine--glycine ligase [Syntrophales bacterium]
MKGSILVLGHGAREHAITETLHRSGEKPRLHAYMKANNPGIAGLCETTCLGNYDDLSKIVSYARSREVEFAVIGPEDPLNMGVVDALAEAGIPSFGPLRDLARLETSKSFTRDLLTKYGIPGNPSYGVFTDLKEIPAFLDGLAGIVVKPDGLTGGKGVMVQGDHFETKGEALDLCAAILREHPSVTVEERLEGEEFSLQCLCNGKTVVPTPPVQDHKRRFVGDRGPNTGGMGSYSCEDHSLPFLGPRDLEEALEITRRVAEAIHRETGRYYKGVMYGGFIATVEGVRLLEYNARFGDPEAMNILPLMETDFVAVCRAVVAGGLEDLRVSFARKATVCKYIVPKGYGLPADHPDASSTAAPIEVGDVGAARLYYASVDRRPDGLYMSTSRAIGVVGIGEDLEEAERIAEAAVSAVRGPVDHRPDIGTAALIARRVQHMNSLRRK